MGMFPAQNYGSDFVQGATSMGDFLLRKQQTEENQKRTAVEDQRTTDRFKREQLRWHDEDTRKSLNEQRARVASGNLSSEDQAKAYQLGAPQDLPVAQVNTDPSLPPDQQGPPTQLDELKQKILNRQSLSPEEIQFVAKDTSNIKWLQSPEGRQRQKVLQAKLITGIQNGEPDHIIDALNDGILGDIQHGDARDQNGNIVGPDQIASKKVDNVYLAPDGRVFLTKKVTLKDGYSYSAPATVGGAADDNAPVAHETIPGVVDKLSAQRALIDLYDSQLAGLGDEAAAKRTEERATAQDLGRALRASIKDAPKASQGQLKVAADLLESGQAKDTASALALAKTIKPEKTGFTLKEGETYFAAEPDATGQYPKLAENLKTQTPPPQHSYKKDGYEFTDRWDPMKGEYVTIAKSKIKEPADPAVAANKHAETESRGAIDKTIAEMNAAKARLAAAKKAYDPADPNADDSDVRTAQQELDDAKAAYQGRTREYRSTYGREYSPLKEVVDRKPERDIAPLKKGFADQGGPFTRRDYPAFIKSAEGQGWTPDEIQRAAKGTPGAQDVASYYAAKPTRSTPAASSTPSTAPSQPRGMAPAKQTAKAPAGGYVYQNGKLVRR